MQVSVYNCIGVFWVMALIKFLLESELFQSINTHETKQEGKRHGLVDLFGRLVYVK